LEIGKVRTMSGHTRNAISLVVAGLLAVAAISASATSPAVQGSPMPGASGNPAQHQWQGGGNHQQGPEGGAGQGEQDQKRFQEMKAKTLEMIAKHQSALTNFQSCVESASSHDQLRECHEQARHVQQELRQQGGGENRR